MMTANDQLHSQRYRANDDPVVFQMLKIGN